MSALSIYLESEMRMNKIYQPIIIRGLLRSSNRHKTFLIEEAALQVSLLTAVDHKATKYFIGKLKIHPKKVLTARNIAVIPTGSDSFVPGRLIKELTEEERDYCANLCNKKIGEYLTREISK